MTTRGFSSQRPAGVRCDSFVRAACWFDFPHMPAGTIAPMNTLQAPGGVTLAPDGQVWFAETSMVGTVIPFRGVRVCAHAPSTSDLVGAVCPHPDVPTFRLTHSGAPYVQLTCPRFTLRYCDWPNEPPFVRRRVQIALMHPAREPEPPLEPDAPSKAA